MATFFIYRPREDENIISIATAIFNALSEKPPSNSKHEREDLPWLHSFDEIGRVQLDAGQVLVVEPKSPLFDALPCQKTLPETSCKVESTSLSDCIEPNLTRSNFIKPMYLGSWCNTAYSYNDALVEAELSIVFSGLAHVETALAQSRTIKSHLVGEQYIAFGGGDVGGSFHPCCVDAITEAIKTGVLRSTFQDSSQGYDGIAYCLQEGVAGLADALEDSFLVAKEYGFKVLLSCVPPFDFADKEVLLPRLLTSKNMDIFSPSLYVTGLEEDNVYCVVDGISDYGFCSAAIVPSLMSDIRSTVPTTEQRYRDAMVYFARKGRVLDGFLLSD